jgi:NAD(P)-dependent dehydrogenase (short-subunit alcohol dehydrogenase family)
MLAQGAPATIGIVSSTSAVVSMPFQSAYSSSKHAALALTESLYLDLREVNASIRVSAILPSFIRTEIFDAAARETAVDGMAGDAFAALAEGMRASGMDADVAAAIIIEGLQRGDFWIFTDEVRASQLLAQRATRLMERSLPRPPQPVQRTPSQ